MFTVLRGSRFGIDLDGIEILYAWNGRDAIADPGFQNLSDIRGGVCADQQNPLVLVSEAQCSCTGERRFANAALTGEEYEFREIIEHDYAKS